ncbi:long-chain-acyl-CoA synthetase [Solimonas terrae]|uniref:Long-chain-acyl-CoA synthetase n=1 Tax=Solimonas terrae TaxID=1396819 RepID=A0A6M2BTZ5_9GAMM|nr:long-chain-acyl-CoA synthetase [Solimonas terrae]NGY05459.1 long-chain-acyl-CoA synthetase [Solimonas terrae]
MSADRVRLRDLLRGVASTLPDFTTTQRGLWNLLRLKPDTTLSIGLRFAQLAAAQPQATALRFEDRSWSYAEFNAWANRIAHALAARGVGPGDAVALLFENRPEALACALAVVKLGAIAAMLNPQQRGELLAHSIGLVKARAVVVGDECRAALESTRYAPSSSSDLLHYRDGDGGAPEGYLDLRTESAAARADNPQQTAMIRLRDPCFYIFTSGTTGLPKASRMTHYRWMRSLAGVGQLAVRMRRDDVLYCPLPLYHNNALTVSWSATLSAGCTLALGRKFSASRFWDEIRSVDATAFCYIGELCRYLLNQPPKPGDREHRVRLVIGNGLRAELWDEFQQRFGIERICEFYGASEANLAFVNGFGLARTAGFCPMPFAIVEFDAENDAPRRAAGGFLQRVAKGGVGLLITEVTERAPFDGYTDPKASDAKLLRNVFKAGDCWFNSGDLVRDQGFSHIQFVDRVGDTFRWKGENVATTEVEGVLNQFATITEAVVYGVQLPNADGRAGMAALSLSADFDGAALAAHLCARLPAYAVPLFVRLRSAQETTATFKFRKLELKQQGFDPSMVNEPLYVLRDRQRGYERLDAETFAAIQRNELRF